MRRRERRLFAITDGITRLRATLDEVLAELGVLRHLQDDAVRDAVVGGPVEREDAREGGRDVARFEKLATDLAGQIEKLEEKRLRLMDQIAE
ncbi:MAG TPA: hypothetical protein VFY15_05585 [Acidimicrobiia bacterium]|nr:hypothetical protein [Acidimicrobiia bacterium]